MPPLYARSRGPRGNPATTREGGPAAQELRSPSASQETCSGCSRRFAACYGRRGFLRARKRSQRPCTLGPFCFLPGSPGPFAFFLSPVPRGQGLSTFFDPLGKALSRLVAGAFSSLGNPPRRVGSPLSVFLCESNSYTQATGLEQAPRRNIRKRQVGSVPACLFFVGRPRITEKFFRVFSREKEKASRFLVERDCFSAALRRFP